MHGTLVDVYGVGLLFSGRSAIGKSEIALDLVERGHRLVADDVVEVFRHGDAILEADKFITDSWDQTVYFHEHGAFPDHGLRSIGRARHAARHRARITEGIRRLGRVLAEVLEPAVAGV